MVVTTGAITGEAEKDVEEVEYLSQVKIIEEAKKNGIQKYIIISAALIERPWHPIAVLLNTVAKNIYEYKIQCENHLRRSGLNYIIIRPPHLADGKDEKLG